MADDLHPNLLPTADLSRNVEPTSTVDATAASASTIDRSVRLIGDAIAPTIPGYVITGELAHGGMGVVYAGKELKLNREVAIKTLLPGADATRFLTESEITARLPHPGIPPVYALGELDDGSPYLAMKLIRGRTLAALLQERSSPADDLSKFIAVFEQIAQAVGFAHEQRIIHRDLKPLNVMVGAFGEVQVMDWGLAKVLASQERERPESTSDSDDFAHTSAGAIMGTPGYMAPEQARGELADARADVFALGAILAAIVTGKPAFVGTTAKETIEKAARADLSETLERLDASASDVELIALAKECLAAESGHRPTDAKVVAKRVGEYRLGVEQRLKLAETAKAEALVREAEGEKRRRVIQWTASLGSLAAIVTVVVAAFSYVKVRTAETEQKYQGILTGRETWKSQLESAKRQAQRGDWKKSLEILEEMDGEFATDPVARKLEIVRALGGLQRLDDARTVVESIRDPGEHEAEVTLARLNFPATDSSDLAELDRELRRALELGTLSPANSEYVEGTLAETTDVAIECYRKALEYDPTHHAARSHLGLLLIATGEYDEVTRVSEISRAFFPLDHTFAVHLALSAQMTGDRAGVRNHLESAKSQLDPAAMAFLEELFAAKSDIDALLMKSLETGTDNSSFLIARLFAVTRRIDGRMANAFQFHNYANRSLRRIGAALIESYSQFLNPFGNRDTVHARAMASLESALVGHRDGALFFATTAMQFKAGEECSGDAGFRRHDELVRRLERTAHWKWSMPQFKCAMHLQVVLKLVELALAVREGRAPKDFDQAELRRRLKTAAEAAALAPNTAPWMFSTIAMAAEYSGDRALHRRMAEQWVERQNKEPRAKMSLIRAEMSLGNVISVLEMLDDVEPKLPKDTLLPELAKRIRAVAVEKLRSAAAKLSETKPAAKTK